MTVLRTKDARKMGNDDLGKRVSELRLGVAKEKANIAIGAPVSSPGKMRDMKRSIARALTIRKEKGS
ncbi:MAG: 50S ribosomal protein L29 [Candidatus Aenigmatarchaeota archaeon]|jgi:large subunit ribosomal protein L29